MRAMGNDDAVPAPDLAEEDGGLWYPLSSWMTLAVTTLPPAVKRGGGTACKFGFGVLLPNLDVRLELLSLGVSATLEVTAGVTGGPIDVPAELPLTTTNPPVRRTSGRTTVGTSLSSAACCLPFWCNCSRPFDSALSKLLEPDLRTRSLDLLLERDFVASRDFGTANNSSSLTESVEGSCVPVLRWALPLVGLGSCIASAGS